MNIIRSAPINSQLYQSAILLSLQTFSSQNYNRNPSQPPLSPLIATFDSLLFRLISHTNLHQFDQIHTHLITSGLFRSTFAANYLLKSSSTSLNFHLTLLLFSQLHSPNLFSYNIAIKSLSQTSHPLKSLPLYINLLLSGFHPNEYTFCFLLDCCTVSLAAHEGRQLHAQLFNRGFNLSVYSSTSLVHMYGRCGSLHDAHQVFDEMPSRSNVSWGAMINAFLTQGELLRGWKLFPIMCRLGFRPTKPTLVNILFHCAEQGELEIGRVVHGYIVVSGFEQNITLGTSLINIYSNCGSIATAMEAFDAMPVKNVASWNCLIRGLAINGFGVKAVEFFERMKQDVRVRPNGVTFLCALQACAHAGLVEVGVRYFLQMSTEYGIMPSLKHYGSVIDLYGRAGKVMEAMKVIRTMPLKPDYVIWVSMFSAFRTYGYMEVRELMSANFIKLCADDCGYLLLSGAYASGRQWDDVVGVRSMMLEMDIKRVPGVSSICTAAC